PPARAVRLNYAPPARKAGDGRRSHCVSSASPISDRPMRSAQPCGYTSSRPAQMNAMRSHQRQRTNTQFCAPQASAAMPADAVSAIQPTSPHDTPGGGLSSSPAPAGSSTKTKGSRKAGSVYFQDCSVVLYGLPPVMAAAANGDSAVGGDTSDSTA